MFNRRKITLVSSFILLIFAFGLIAMSTQAEKNSEPNQVSLTAYRPSAPIQVTGDGDFDPVIWNEDSTSDGSYCKPWILDGWEFDGDVRAIEIYDTQEYFIIRNCSFRNCDVGILLHSMENGRVCENYFYSNDYGIVLNYTAEDTCISMNTFNLNSKAISLQFTENINIFSNIIMNSDDGIDLVGSRYTFVKYNNVTTNTNIGIRLVAAKYTLIEKNNIEYNTGHGVALLDAMYNEILKNNFVDNHGVVLQGYDDLMLNKWFENYWNDWISGPYAIDGPGSNSDSSPSSSLYVIGPEDKCLCDSCYCELDITQTDFVNIITISISLLVAVTMVRKSKRKQK